MPRMSSSLSLALFLMRPSTLIFLWLCLSMNILATAHSALKPGGELTM